LEIFFCVLLMSIKLKVSSMGYRIQRTQPLNRFVNFDSLLRRQTTLNSVLNAEDIESYGLPPVLKGYVEGFRKVADDKLRYQQLLFLAAKCKPLPDAFKIPENKVPGCLSTVFVHATMNEDGTIHFQGDSDSQLTKGLVTMLINGLTGCTNEQIQNLKPEFVTYANIAKSLTPGRNNGFLNMLNKMKQKANELYQTAHPNPNPTSVATIVSSNTSNNPINSSNGNNLSNNNNGGGEGGKIYQSIVKKLSMLKPQELVVEDESYKHAGHAGVIESGSSGGETHFNVRIVAACFESLSLVQRHKMVYTLLAQEMNNGVHALSIKALTPTELSSNNKK